MIFISQWYVLLLALLVLALALYFLRRRFAPRRQTSASRGAVPPPTAHAGPPEQHAPLPTTAEYRPGPPGGGEEWPARVGRYRILGLLGAGGMGAVYRAHDPELNRAVALKLPRFDGPPEDVRRRMERFQREARAAAQVWHPNVCPLFDVGEDRGRPFVVMALVEGRSLAQHLAAGAGPADARAAVALVRQVLDGLGAVHTHGIIHRDLKPANILLDAAGRAILTDFGLALPPSEAGALTSEGVIVGTPSYMAPEQAAGQAERLGPWTDLYSLGVVLYEMLTGRPPFRGSGPAVLAQVLRDQPPPPRQFRPDLDPGLETIVLRALDKDPAQRYQDAAALAAALGAWASEAGPASVPAASAFAVPAESDSTLVPPRLRRGFPRSRVVGILVGGVLVTVAMALLAVATLAVLLSAWGQCAACVFGSLVLFLMGLMVWVGTERGYVPEGLLDFAHGGVLFGVRGALAHGVSPNVRDEMRETPLMRAAAGGHTAVVKLLLVHGADPALRSRFGQTAEEIARANGKADVAVLLQVAGPPVAAAAYPLPRFNFPLALVVAGWVGALLAAGVLWLFNPGGDTITSDGFSDLLSNRQVASATLIPDGKRGHWVEGEVKDLGHPAARRLGLLSPA